MTSVIDTPDCGVNQSDCGNDAGAELSEQHLDNLVNMSPYLGCPHAATSTTPRPVRVKRSFPRSDVRLCHRPTLPPPSSAGRIAKSNHSPLYRLATARPWRRHGRLSWKAKPAAQSGELHPVGIGLGACVTGGVVGPNQNQVCEADGYLHDGRARSLHDDFVAWRRGANARSNYLNRSEDEQDALQRFLRSL